MRRSRAICTACIASLMAWVLLGCGKERAAGPKRSNYRYQARTATTRAVAPGAVFRDVTREAGVDFQHENGAAGQKLLPETMGSGVGMLDYDGDGDLDLLFVQSEKWETKGPQPAMRLYRNDGNWHFTDVTKAAGLDSACYGMGVSIADYDADGDPDLYVTALGPNLLFRNDNARFKRVAGGPDGGWWVDEKGKRHPSWSTGAAWLDADGDGDLDLVVVSYVRWTKKTDVYASLVEGEKAYTRPQLYPGDSPRLYLQQKDGRFTDATATCGFAKTKTKGKSLALCLDDFDGDGRTDIFIANDTVQNFLFLALGGGRYREAAVEAAVGYDDNGQARAAMGVQAMDFRNDGRLTVVIGNFSEEPVSLYTVTRAKNGSVLFQDDANTARIGRATLLPLTFGVVGADIDLDGWCDLVFANGHIEPSITKLKKELQYAQPPQYFRNLQGKRFADVSVDAGPPFSTPIVGRGLAAGDLDGDGDPDLVLTANGGRPMVLRCDEKTQNRMLRLRLRQPKTRNLDALGAIVKITVNGVTQRRVVRTGGSYLSQGDLTLTFGLGTATRAEKVTVRWPDGTLQTFGPLSAGPKPQVLVRR